MSKAGIEGKTPGENGFENGIINYRTFGFCQLEEQRLKAMVSNYGHCENQKKKKF